MVIRVSRQSLIPIPLQLSLREPTLPSLSDPTPSINPPELLSTRLLCRSRCTSRRITTHMITEATTDPLSRASDAFLLTFQTLWFRLVAL